MEVDGGWHFSRSAPYVPLGRAVAKWRCLEMRGWRVASVPWFQWRALSSDSAAAVGSSGSASRAGSTLGLVGEADCSDSTVDAGTLMGPGSTKSSDKISSSMGSADEEVGAAAGGQSSSSRSRRGSLEAKQRYLEDLMDGVLWRTHQTTTSAAFVGPAAAGSRSDDRDSPR